MADEFSYYKINKLLWRWSEKNGARIVDEVGLSMDKAPPALPKQREPKTAQSAPTRKSPKPDPIIKMVDDMGKAVDAFSRFKTWLNTPDSPKPPKSAPTPKTEKTGPPFDIQEIPGAMRREFMSRSAALLERWFAGELNYGPTASDVAAEINQKGEPYPASMYDTKTIKLDWVLQFARARSQYDALVKDLIRAPHAQGTLKNILRRYGNHLSLDAWSVSGGKLSSLHRHFQFQLAGVGSSFSQKIGEMWSADVDTGGVPDDLNGALGSFNFYAAIAYATFSSGGKIADISGIYVYIKDSFDFTDKPGEVSQYLGHWSSKGVIVVPYNAVMSYLDKPSLYFAYPVAVGDSREKGNVYYPVHNRDFRQWASKHQRGGDFYVYTDYRFVPIYPPMRVYL